MIPKYIQTEIDRLKDLKKGMTTNAVNWTGQPISTGDIDASITILNTQADELETARQQLSIKQQTIHQVVNDQAKVGDQAESLARGIHAQEPEKLTDYDIKHGSTPPAALPVPAKANINKISDDSDGEGFVIEITSLAGCSDFEIWRGKSASPDVLVLAPESFSFLTVTKKLSYTDDGVVKGTRYFYMVRGFNRTGKGEWSATVSRVQ